MFYRHQTYTRGSFIPVMSIPRADFRLRTETSALLELLGLDTPALIFGDEVDLITLHATDRLRLTLTEHNQLALPVPF